jgi:hypothetical protein
MPIRGLRREAEQRLHEFTGFDRTTVETFLADKESRRHELARLIHQDEIDNEEFYRELGDR